MSLKHWWYIQTSTLQKRQMLETAFWFVAFVVVCGGYWWLG